MHGRFELLLQNGVNAPLAFDARQPLEDGGNQMDMKMGFPMASIVTRGAGMTRMAGAFVPHLKRQRRKSGGQFLPNGIGDFHHFVVCFRRPKVKRYLSLSFHRATP